MYRSLRIAILFGVTFAMVIVYAMSRPISDFSVYWAATHLFVAHQNPYSFSAVYSIQLALGSTRPVPLMFLCPPWALVLLSPLGFAHSYVVAWLAWVAVLA